ncbi:MAG: glycosyl hydrolase [Candidatus Dormibacteria bacterium]
MWEMNGNWFPWGTEAMTAAHYISVYRAAERAFAAVPGNRFQFVWNVNVGTIEPGRTEFDTYPGNAYVSNIGLDFYDYNRAIGAGAPDRAVAPILAFAAEHHRPTSLDEWGLDGRDDPTYIDYVAQLVHNPGDHVTVQSYFSDGRSNILRYPRAMAEYTKDFSVDSPAGHTRTKFSQ